MANEIHLLNGCLELDDEFDEDVLRGTLDQECLRHINVDTYQRQAGFSTREIQQLCELYFVRKKTADVTLGMRGDRYRNENNEFWLQDKVYVIDGLQRLYAARTALTSRPQLLLRIGVKLWFNTNYTKEKDMFNAMNATQQRVAPSVLVRNQSDTSMVAKFLLELTADHDFALKDRIGWNQRRVAGQALSGFCLVKIAGALHAHKGSLGSGRHEDVLASCDNVAIKINPPTMYGNLVKFFDIVDEAWGIRDVKNPSCLKEDFLKVLARLFASYDTFWDGDELFLADRFLKKLRKFDQASIDQQVKQMSRHNVDAKDVLFGVLRDRLGIKDMPRKPPPKDAKGAGVHAGV